MMNAITVFAVSAVVLTIGLGCRRYFFRRYFDLPMIGLFDAGLRMLPLGQGWEKYDPSWLIALAKVQRPEDSELVEALSRCTSCLRVGTEHVLFVAPGPGVKMETWWYKQASIGLDNPMGGEVELKIGKDGAVGGVRQVNEMEGRRRLTTS